MTKRLGPFLSKPTPTSMSFWMYAEDSADIEITVHGHSGSPIILSTLKEDPIYPIYVGIVVGLESNSQYKYSIKIDKKVYLPQGVFEQDLKFKTLPDDDSEINFITMSCHGIKEYEKHKTAEDLPTWNCWDNLYNEISKNPVQLLVLGGDQVYMDSYFDKEIGSLNQSKNKEYREIIKKCYLDYWGHPSYQRILCQIPSVLMWDDHDIIDGFGSRPDAYNFFSGDTFKNNWLLLGELQKEAFLYFQGSRNPSKHLIDLDNNFSFDFNHPSFSLLALDLRSERNVKKNQMISESSKTKIEEAAKKLSGRRIFIVSPVTVARMAGPIEAGFGQFSNAIWRITSFTGPKPNAVKTLIAVALFLISYLCFAIYNEGLRFFWGSGFVWISSLLLILLACFPKLRYLSDGARKISLWILWGLFIFTSLYLVDICISDYFLTNFKNFSFKESLGAIWDTKKLILFSSLIIPLISTYKTAKEIKTKAFLKTCYGLNFGLVTLFIWNMHLSVIFSKLDWIMLIILYVTSSIFLFNTIFESLGVIDELAGLDDDIKDGWSSKENEKELTWLKDKILLNALVDRETYILSGDIHTGGLTNLFFDKRLIPQITSSPISYFPMPAIGEKLTSGSKPIFICDKDKKHICTAENVFYISERNFVRVSLLVNSVEIKYFFEKHKEAVVVSYKS